MTDTPKPHDPIRTQTLTSLRPLVEGTVAHLRPSLRRRRGRATRTLPLPTFSHDKRKKRKAKSMTGIDSHFGERKIESE